MKLLLAPLQGFTDAIFRQVYAEHFGHIDAYYAPYIALQNDGSIRPSQWCDILPERNDTLLVPQILPANAEEALELTSRLVELNAFKEVNINLGCPYPMVTNKGRGSALLQKPEELRDLLEALFNRFGETIDFSVKMRCGLVDFDEIYEVVKVLNDFPLAYSILHPRVAKQLYKGKADQTFFKAVMGSFKSPIYYNGDINSLEDYHLLVSNFPKLEGVMLGRGILQNPLLPTEIKTGEILEFHQKLELFSQFHNALFQTNEEYLSGESHLLSKMKSYLPYFLYFNPSNRKAYKKVKKCKGIRTYQEGMEELLSL